MADNKVEGTIVKDLTANPAPLGLLGFGMTTVLLNIHNAGFFSLSTMILAMGIFYGGMAQVIAGIMEWKKGNTFGTTAFTSYGFFWLSLAAIIVMPKLGMGTAAEPEAMAAYLFIWGLLTLFFSIAAIKLNVATKVIFFSLTILFFLLAIGKITGNTAITTFAGYEGIFCGFSAFYSAVAQVINEVFKKTVLPLGK